MTHARARQTSTPVLARACPFVCARVTPARRSPPRARRAGVAAGLLVLCAGLATASAAGAKGHPAPAARQGPRTAAGAPTPTVAIPAGSYRPFFPGKDEPERKRVAAFQLEATPVTVAQFAAFVRAHPRWQRGKVPRIFADAAYLSTWAGPTRPGMAGDTVATHVSWFAARAYCRSLGRRLPALAEWERAALASASSADGRKEPGFSARILRWYGHPARGRAGPVGRSAANFLGVRDLHGLVWEWVEDFNTALVTGESRADAALERGLYCGAGAIGAADPSDYAAFMRFALRSSLKAAYTTGSLGFRCAADAPPPRAPPAAKTSQRARRTKPAPNPRPGRDRPRPSPRRPSSTGVQP